MGRIVLASLRDARSSKKARRVHKGCRFAQPLATGFDGSAIRRRFFSRIESQGKRIPKLRV